MTYSEQLHPWCVVRYLSKKEYVIVSRFRRRDDAVAYLKVLRNTSKNTILNIIFQQPKTKNSPTTQTLKTVSQKISQ